MFCRVCPQLSLRHLRSGSFPCILGRTPCDPSAAKPAKSKFHLLAVHSINQSIFTGKDFCSSISIDWMNIISLWIKIQQKKIVELQLEGLITYGSIEINKQPVHPRWHSIQKHGEPARWNHRSSEMDLQQEKSRLAWMDRFRARLFTSGSCDQEWIKGDFYQSFYSPDPGGRDEYSHRPDLVRPRRPDQFCGT